MDVDDKKSSLHVAFDFDIKADLMNCLFQGLIAALPCFLDSFMKCMGGGGNGGTGFTPGDRPRC